MEEKGRRWRLFEIESYIREKYKKIFQNSCPRIIFREQELESFLDKENWKEIVDYRINYMKENNWEMFIISDYFEKVKNDNMLSSLVKLPIAIW